MVAVVYVFQARVAAMETSSTTVPFDIVVAASVDWSQLFLSIDDRGETPQQNATNKQTNARTIVPLTHSAS